MVSVDLVWVEEEADEADYFNPYCECQPPDSEVCFCDTPIEKASIAMKMSGWTVIEKDREGGHAYIVCRDNEYPPEDSLDEQSNPQGGRLLKPVVLPHNLGPQTRIYRRPLG